MVELDSLDRNIRTLKELQTVAWQQLADRSATTLECQDLRNQLRHTGNELRYYLEMKSQRARFRHQPVDDNGIGFGQPALLGALLKHPLATSSLPSQFRLCQPDRRR